MKRIRIWQIVAWCCLGCGALFVAIVGGMLGLPGWVRLVGSLLLGIACLAWIGVALLRARPRSASTPASFASGDPASEPLLRDAKLATDRYVNAWTRAPIFASRILYGRPWFLVFGPPGAGKSNVLDHAGVRFPVRYPSEKDGLQVAGAAVVRYLFGNDAVWVDIPGTFTDDAQADRWLALADALGKVRPRRPADGAVVVVSAAELLEADAEGIKSLAARLRNRVDDIIARWGIEFPVYLLISNADSIPGFATFFDTTNDKNTTELLGAAVASEQQRTLPRRVFLQEFQTLCSSLARRRIGRLAAESDADRRRHICRFVIQFESLAEKLGSLIAELFRPSNYIGKPLFRGFYFTSCVQVEGAAPVQASQSKVSSTIADHPLNPHRATKKTETPTSGGARYRTTFARTLMTTVMPRDRSLVKSTAKKTRARLLRDAGIGAAAVVLAVTLVTMMVGARRRSSRAMRSIGESVHAIGTMGTSLPQQYKSLAVLGSEISRLERGSGFLERIFGFSRSDRLLEQLRPSHALLLSRLVAAPATAYFERQIADRARTYGHLSAEKYDELYQALKGYLTISEAAGQHRVEVDSAWLATQLQTATTATLLAALRSQRLPQSLETTLKSAVGHYVDYLRSGICSPVQEDQQLVKTARERLRRLPSAENLYTTVAEKQSTGASDVTLDDILKRTGEGLLNSHRTISTLYTPEGWRQTLSSAISDASKNPYAIDWVVGFTREDIPASAFDEDKLEYNMTEAYARDCRTQWLDLLSSVKLESFGTLERSARMVRKLAAPESEIEVLLRTVAEQTSMSRIEAPKGVEKALAKTGVDADGARKSMDAAAKKTRSLLGRSEGPFDELNVTFAPLRSFVESSAGGMAGLEGYRDRLMALADQLDNVASEGADAVPMAFNGSDADALYAGWRHTEAITQAMPRELGAPVRGVLMAPFEQAGAAVSAVLATTLNQWWQEQVAKPFVERLSGKYPFVRRSQEASFADAMDFFRPETGTLWGFYDRVLAPFIVRSKDGWRERPLGSVHVSFRPELAATLTKAQRLRKMLFKPNGELRSLTLKFVPAHSGRPAALEVEGQKVSLTPGGKPATLRWPIESHAEGVALRVQLPDGSTRDLAFEGAWGMLRLLQSAKLRPLNRSAFTAVWHINVQGMYQINHKYRVEVAGGNHPFLEPVFEEFDCPTLITVPAGNSG